MNSEELHLEKVFDRFKAYQEIVKENSLWPLEVGDSDSDIVKLISIGALRNGQLEGTFLVNYHFRAVGTTEENWHYVDDEHFKEETLLISDMVLFSSELTLESIVNHEFFKTKAEEKLILLDNIEGAKKELETLTKELEDFVDFESNAAKDITMDTKTFYVKHEYMPHEK